MKKKTKSLYPNLAVALREMIGEVHELKFALDDALSKANKHLARLSFNAKPDTEADRFRGWCAAELDKRNTGKPEIPGIPAVIRSAHIKDLEAWLSETLRRQEAARAAAFATCFDGDDTRDVSVRWPELRQEDD